MTLSDLMALVESLLAEVRRERLRRWDVEYPVGHADREARRPTGTLGIYSSAPAQSPAPPRPQ